MTDSSTNSMHVDGGRLRADLEALAQFGATSDGGVSRTTFSAADRAARAWLSTRCQEAGLEMRTDGIGNIFIRARGMSANEDALPVRTGSHIDSVPNGGRFDGALGSIAAIEVARRLVEDQVPLRRPVEVVIFADEEGCYHHLLGSTAMARGFTASEVENMVGRDGDRLIEAMAAMDLDAASAARSVVGPDSTHAFVELHIEQGPVLEAGSYDIGVVTSIVGMGSGQLTFTGRPDHAGTTPMLRRQDALRGAGDLLTRLPDIAASVSTTAVVTCGILQVEPGGANVVPGVARLQLDFRDSERGRLMALEETIVAAARLAGERHGLQVSYERESITDPAPLDPRLQDLIEYTAGELGHNTFRVPSGAGHDSQNTSRLAPTGMIFIPSTDGRSHSPAEHSSWEDITVGADVLLNTVLRLATA